jgi:opacity protein-like surface antigen
MTGRGLTSTINFGGAHLVTYSPAVHLLVRYPGRTFQPYAGIGLAVVNANLSSPLGSSSTTPPGLNALAGVRGFVTSRLALFGEFKYTNAALSFDNVGRGISASAGYSVPALVGGISLNF